MCREVVHLADTKLRHYVIKDSWIGAGHATLVEPRTQVREYAGQWDRTVIDREELARLRFVEGWGLRRLQAHFACGRTKIKKELEMAQMSFL